MSLRIAFFIGDLEFGGAEKVAMTLANQAHDDGHIVEVIVVRKGGVLENNLRHPISLISFDRNHAYKTIVPLSKHLAKTRPDLIISFMENANVVSLIAVFLARVSTKVCASVHSPFEFSLNRVPLVRRVVLKFLIGYFYPRASAIVCVSKGTLESILLFFNRSMKNAVIIHNPIEGPKRFGEIKLRPTGQEITKFKFIYVGRLVPEKDIVTLLLAFKIVLRSIYSELIIFGDGPCKDILMNKIDDLDLQKAVVLFGYERDLEKIYRDADCLVLCSKNESFGNVLLEALSFGCRVISTDCPVGPREVLGDGRWGKLVPVGDPYALAEAMIACADDNHSTDVRALGEYLESFSPKTILEKYLQSVGLSIQSCQIDSEQNIAQK